MWLSTLPPDSGSLISKLNAKCTFIWKEDFRPLSNSPVLFLLSPGKMLLTMFLVQKWLGSSFPEDVWAWWLLMHWLQLQFTPCEAFPSVWICFAWQYSQASTFVCLSLKLNSVVHTVLSNLYLWTWHFDIICAKHSYTSWLKAHKERSMDASHLNFCLLYWNTVHLGV